MKKIMTVFIFALFSLLVCAQDAKKVEIPNKIVGFWQQYIEMSPDAVSKSVDGKTSIDFSKIRQVDSIKSFDTSGKMTHVKFGMQGAVITSYSNYVVKDENEYVETPVFCNYKFLEGRHITVSVEFVSEECFYTTFVIENRVYHEIWKRVKNADYIQ
ncbi:MAG: DUF4488 domain-containing protein [Dysgonamonadaceae bacterium]|jgi:uncharacterized protein YxeA|nr:DUF4488 domain-containing protein [Dysgonamonadaceae bacterium]